MRFIVITVALLIGGAVGWTLLHLAWQPSAKKVCLGHPDLSRLPSGPSANYAQTGRTASGYGDGIPIALDLAAIERGKRAYATDCESCHGPDGKGDGLVTHYGIEGVANLQTPRIGALPDGVLFDTITRGRGKMIGYGDSIPTFTRWEIVAYVRALQTHPRDFAVTLAALKKKQAAAPTP